jgi:hypothetical protein
MKFGAKTEPTRCSRCMRTKNDAIKEQKAKGAICTDGKCTFKQTIQQAVGIVAPPPFVSKYCNHCGKSYNKPISKFCSYCGKKRN